MEPLYHPHKARETLQKMEQEERLIRQKKRSEGEYLLQNGRRCCILDLTSLVNATQDLSKIRPTGVLP